MSGGEGQWANVVNTLKKLRRPLTLEDFEREGYSRLAERFPTIITALKSTKNIKYDPQKETFQWIFEYNLHKGKEDLKRLLALNREKQGFLLSELEESYPGELQRDVQELEMTKDLLLIRNNDRGSDMRKWRVFYNDPSLTLPVDTEFKDMWESVTPALPDNFELALREVGLKALAEEKKVVEATGTKKRKTGNRRIKIVNTHLDIDLTKDYVVPTK